MTAAPKIHPLEAAALAALFAAAISLPVVKQLFFGEPDTSATEKRTLASWPRFAGGWKWRIKSLPLQFDAYYADHFGFRSLLLEASSLLNVDWFIASQRTVIGKNGWLFLKMDPPLFSQSLDGEDLAKWKSYLEHRQRWLAARGIRYLFVVPPDKDSIYPEFLPPTVRRQPAELPVDQLARYLKETHSSVEILSLREPLLAAKTREQEPLYYEQDTHWNSLGAFYAYEATMRRLSMWFPAMKAKSRGDYRLAFARETERDLAHLAGLPDSSALRGPVLQPLTPDSAQEHMLPIPGFDTQPFMTQLPDPGNLPRAVMMCDSFIIAFAPYLSENFSRITYLQRTYNSREYEKITANTILKEKPDVFIEERIQRFMIVLPDESIMFGGAENQTPGH